MIVEKLSNKFKLIIWEKKHKKIKSSYRKRFKGNSPTIISCNCIGGILYHELGLKFTSPTINLYMNCEDFIKFCENLKYYLSLQITSYNGPIERDYPLGKLGDLTIYFVHYSNLEEAIKKWNERKKRIDWNKIFIIATDRDGCTNQLLERFERLPYKNKRLFTHIEHKEYPSTYYIKGYENDIQIEGLMYKTKNGHYLIDQFDWVDWFNKG